MLIGRDANTARAKRVASDIAICVEDVPAAGGVNSSPNKTCTIVQSIGHSGLVVHSGQQLLTMLMPMIHMMLQVPSA